MEDNFSDDRQYADRRTVMNANLGDDRHTVLSSGVLDGSYF